MDKKLYAECEQEFTAIYMDLAAGKRDDAKTRAWRMMMKLEELRLRHPVI